MRLLRKIGRDRRGASAIEYALVASLIAIAGIVAFRGLGTQISSSFEETTAAIGR
jgi:pilus assembly protein Flp/PilA